MSLNSKLVSEYCFKKNSNYIRNFWRSLYKSAFLHTSVAFTHLSFLPFIHPPSLPLITSTSICSPIYFFFHPSTHPVSQLSTHPYIHPCIPGSAHVCSWFSYDSPSPNFLFVPTRLLHMKLDTFPAKNHHFRPFTASIPFPVFSISASRTTVYPVIQAGNPRHSLDPPSLHSVLRPGIFPPHQLQPPPSPLPPVPVVVPIVS